MSPQVVHIEDSGERATSGEGARGGVNPQRAAAGEAESSEGEGVGRSTGSLGTLRGPRTARTGSRPSNFLGASGELGRLGLVSGLAAFAASGPGSGSGSGPGLAFWVGSVAREAGLLAGEAAVAGFGFGFDGVGLASGIWGLGF